MSIQSHGHTSSPLPPPKKKIGGGGLSRPIFKWTDKRHKLQICINYQTECIFLIEPLYKKQLEIQKYPSGKKILGLQPIPQPPSDHLCTKLIYVSFIYNTTTVIEWGLTIIVLLSFQWGSFVQLTNLYLYLSESSWKHTHIDIITRSGWNSVKCCLTLPLLWDYHKFIMQMPFYRFQYYV